MDQATWKLDRFRTNPVVPWGHDYSIPPVGKCVSVSIEEGKLVAEIEWDESEHNPLGRLVAAQFAAGFLNTVSVGFRPGRMIPRSQLEKTHRWYKEAGYGAVYYDCELLEISAVVIPANPEALAAKGLPPMRLTAPEVRAEVLRLFGEDASVGALVAARVLALVSADPEIQRALDDRALDVVGRSAEMQAARAQESQGDVMRAVFGLTK